MSSDGVAVLESTAQKLQLPKWEVSLILQTCTQTSSVDKGIRILGEFSRYVEQLKLLFTKRRKYFSEVHSLLNLSGSQQDILRAFAKLVTTSAKLFYVLSTWRKFHWNPWPIIVFDDQIDPLRSLDELSKNNLTLQSCIEDQSSILFNTAIQTGIDLFAILPLGFLIIVFAPLMEIEEFKEYPVPESLVECQNLYSPSVVNVMDDELYTSIRLVLAHENRLSDVWIAHKRSMRVFPIVRMPFTIPCVHEEMEWFTAALEDYNNCSKVFAAEIKRHPRREIKPRVPLVQPELSENMPTGTALSPPADRVSDTAGEEDTVEPSEIAFQPNQFIAAPFRGIDNSAVKLSDSKLCPSDNNAWIAPDSNIEIGSDGASSSQDKSLARSRPLTAAAILPHGCQKPLDYSRPQSAAAVLVSPQAPTAQDVGQNTAPGVGQDTAQDVGQNTAQDVGQDAAPVAGQDAAPVVGHVIDVGGMQCTDSTTEAGTLRQQADGTEILSGAEASLPYIPVSIPTPMLSTPAHGSDIEKGQGTEMEKGQGTEIALGNIVKMKSLTSNAASKLKSKQKNALPAARNIAARLRSASDDKLGAGSDRAGTLDTKGGAKGTGARALPTVQKSSRGGRGGPAHITNQRRSKNGASNSDSISNGDNSDGDEMEDGYFPEMSFSRSPFMNSALAESSSSVSAASRSKLVAKHPIAAHATTEVSPTDTARSPARGRQEAAPHSRRHSPSRSASGGVHYLTTRHVDAMQTFQSLSRPFHRGEVLAESQVVHLALKEIMSCVQGVDVVDLASRKIAVWWKIVFPRRKLLNRVQTKLLARELLLDLADIVVIKHHIRMKLRRKFLLNGSATRIQRFYRIRYSEICEARASREKEERRRATAVWISRWCNPVLAAVRLFRFIWFCRKKFMKRRRMRPPKRFPREQLRRVFDHYFILQKAHCDNQILKERIKSLMGGFASSAYGANGNKRTEFRKQDRAAVRIQAHVRRYLVEIHLDDIREERRLERIVKSLFIQYLYKFRKRRAAVQNQAAVNIQRMARAMLVRKDLYEKIWARSVLWRAWVRHKLCVDLKGRMRRLERPMHIVLHGLRKVPVHLLNGSLESISVKVSVFWLNVLHILTEKDTSMIIKTKQPQFVFTTKSFAAVPEDDANEAADVGHKFTGKRGTGAVFADEKSSQRFLFSSGVRPQHYAGAVAATAAPRPGLLKRLQSVVSAGRNGGGDGSDNGSSDSDSDSGSDKSDSDSDNDDNIASKSKKNSSMLPRIMLGLDWRKSISHSLTAMKNVTPIGALPLFKAAPVFNPSGRIVNFNDVEIKIPGCHGNSIIYFEFFNGERRVGWSTFFMKNIPGYLFWGGEYSKDIVQPAMRRSVDGGRRFSAALGITNPNRRNAASSSAATAATTVTSTGRHIDRIPFEFSIRSSQALRCRCQFVLLKFTGFGPAKRTMQTVTFLATTTFQWQRMYLSMDERFLDLYEARSDVIPLVSIPVRDLTRAHLETGTSTRGLGGSLVAVEDLFNIVVRTKQLDELKIRCFDSGSRLSLFEVLMNVIHNKRSQSISLQGSSSTLPQRVADRPLSEVPVGFVRDEKLKSIFLNMKQSTISQGSKAMTVKKK